MGLGAVDFVDGHHEREGGDQVEGDADDVPLAGIDGILGGFAAVTVECAEGSEVNDVGSYPECPPASSPGEFAGDAAGDSEIAHDFEGTNEKVLA